MRTGAQVAGHDQPGDEARGTVARLWQQMKDSVLDRVTVLEKAVESLRTGSLGEEQRAGAEREAHRLAGSAGMFGFAAGSRLAREAELTLSTPALAEDSMGRLSAVVSALRTELDQSPDDGQPKPATGDVDTSVVLLVGAEAATSRRMRLEATSRGMRLETAADLDRALALLDALRPAAVLLDLGPESAIDEGLGILDRIAQVDPGLPVVVITGTDSFTDRLEVARRGGRGFLPHPANAEQAFDAVTRSLNAARSDDMTVLALDDDAVVLAGLRLLLEDAGFRLSTLADTTELWARLHEVNPDLLVLDFDMPGANGLELCRVIRNDLRWAELPVVFLTAHTDAESVQRMFAAGADDFVSKPIVGPELAARISNRLERVRLFRRLANTDPLTGLHNRRKSEEAVGRLITMARRYGLHVSLAVVDLDHFKHVNDRYGHAAGDTVLRRVAAMLREAFRGEDVVARWGGEEFVVAFYGAPVSSAVRRLEDLLDRLRSEDVLSGTSLSMTFSAGVAHFPADGDDVQSLYRMADRALYRAKEAGRARVLASA